MKKNLKVNLIWFGLIIGLFLILKGLELSGIMNLYYIQILNRDWNLNPYGAWY